VCPEFAPFTLEIRRNVEKQLDKLSDQDTLRIVEALDRLALLGMGDIKDIGEDYPCRYRFRIGGWRIYFNLDRQVIDVVAIEKRGEAYKKRSRNR
jgi:mRNA-degrading endonuclease RelE of RelBE toxin-antitoxin system